MLNPKALVISALIVVVFLTFSFTNMEVLPLFSELIVFKVYVVNLNVLGMSWIFFVTCQRSPRC